MGKIIVVDDDPIMLEYCKTLLEREGHKVMACSKANDALVEIDGKTKINLMIIDVNIPEFSGFELMDTLNALGVYKGPILMVSGQTERSDVVKAVNLGAWDYMVKPLEQETFLRKVQGLLYRAKTHRRQ